MKNFVLKWLENRLISTDATVALFPSSSKSSKIVCTEEKDLNKDVCIALHCNTSVR